MLKLIRRIAFGSLRFHAGDEVCVIRNRYGRGPEYVEQGTVIKVLYVPAILTENEVRYQVRFKGLDSDVFDYRDVCRIVERLDK